MNPIDELRAARPAHLGDGPVDPRTRQTELSHAFTQPRQVRRRLARPLWGAGLAAAAAAVTAVALVNSGTPAAPPKPPPAAVGSPAELSARQLLLVAATSAESQPPTTGKYWHTKTSGRMVVRVDAGFVLAQRQRGETWAGVGGQWFTSESFAAEPADPADLAAWRAAGSPVKMSAGGKELEVAASRPFSDHVPGEPGYWLGRNVSLADLRKLPTDEAALKAWLLRYYEGHDTEGGTPMAEDAWLFQVTAGLITDMPVTPQVRGAAFRMLAALPSVANLGQVTDVTGRTGTAVAIETDTRLSPDDPAKGVLQDRLIIDTASGRALARESVVVKPGGLQAGLAPGTVWHSQAVVEARWTDTR